MVTFTDDPRKTIEITDVLTSRLVPYDKNPRRIDKNQFEKLVANLENDPEFFSRRPLLVWRRPDSALVVYAGNQRLQAAKRLKWKTCPCVVDDSLTDAQVRRWAVLDNLHHGEFDFDLLANEYDASELLEWGFTEKALDFFNDEKETDAEGGDDGSVLEPGKDEDARTKTGDLYELNEHRIICGDSTDPSVVGLLLSDAIPVLMVTDPPYGVEYNAKWRVESLKDGGNRSTGSVQADERVDWSAAWNLFPGFVAYVWCASWYLPEVAKNLDDLGFERKNLIIWVKQHFALSRGDYHWQHEPCWYAVKKGSKHNWQGARDQSTVWEISNLNAFGGKAEEGEERTAHSTQKPMECMSRPIRNNTAEGEGVYDPFLGSGTTLMAAEKLDRICHGIEISPAYIDICVDRWVKYMKAAGHEFEIKRNGEMIEW